MQICMKIYMHIIFPNIIYEYGGGYRLHLIRKSQKILESGTVGLRRVAAPAADGQLAVDDHCRLVLA